MQHAAPLDRALITGSLLQRDRGPQRTVPNLALPGRAPLHRVWGRSLGSVRRVSLVACAGVFSVRA